MGGKRGRCRDQVPPPRMHRAGAGGAWGREPSLSDGHLHGHVCPSWTLDVEGGTRGGSGLPDPDLALLVGRAPPRVWRGGQGSIQKADAMQEVRTLDSSGPSHRPSEPLKPRLTGAEMLRTRKNEALLSRERLCHSCVQGPWCPQPENRQHGEWGGLLSAPPGSPSAPSPSPACIHSPARELRSLGLRGLPNSPATPPPCREHTVGLQQCSPPLPARSLRASAGDPGRAAG